MFRRSSRTLVLLATLALLVTALRPLSAANTYHIGTGPGVPTGTTTFPTLQALYASLPAAKTLNGDTLIFYNNAYTLTNFGSFTVTGTVNLQTAGTAVDGVTIDGSNIADRLFYVNGGTLNISNDFTFENFNSTQDGVMTVVNSTTTPTGTINAAGVRFINNYSAGGPGGVSTAEWTSVYDPGGTNLSLGPKREVNLREAYFENNTGDNGAVLIFGVERSDLTDATFINNTGYRAGAIYFVDGHNLGTSVTLGASVDGYSRFEGNYATALGRNVSLFFSGAVIAGTTTPIPGLINVNIETAEGGVLDLLDPIYIGAGATDVFTANINKRGVGTWNLGGVSMINTASHVVNSATITIEEGTLHLIEGTEIRMTGDSDSFVTQADAIVEIMGKNVIQGTTVTFERDSILAFDMEYFFTNGQRDPARRNDRMLYLDGTTLSVAGTLVNIDFSSNYSRQTKKGDYKLVEGAGILTQGDFRLTVNDLPITNKRFGYWLDDVYQNVANPHLLVLHVDDTVNTVLLWNNNDGNWRWSGEDKNFYDDYYYRDNDTFIPNDSVIFGGPGSTDGGVFTLTGKMIVSKDTNRLTGDWGTGERGMRVTGSDDWTFNGGSIGDNYSLTSPADDQMIGRSFLAALVFDGSGILTLNNTDANTYHDGTIISGGGTMVVARVDSLGNTEFIGSPTVGGFVQNDGYGIEFSDVGGNIQFNSGTTDANSILRHRIHVDNDSSGTLRINRASLTITADPEYQNYADVSRGGAVKVEENAEFKTSGNGQFRFEANQAGDEGGAIWGGDNSRIIVSGTEFCGNTASTTAGRGGAIYMVGGKDSVFDVSNSVFIRTPVGESGNSAAAGGAIYVENGVPLLQADGTQFIGNEATNGDGGAINFNTVLDASVININNSLVDTNWATGNGGAIFLNDGRTTINANRTDFATNEAGGSGGAIYVGNNVTINASGINDPDGLIQFTDNFAVDSGGAIYAGNNATITAQFSNFASNVVWNGDGGAIRIGANSTLDVSSAFDTNNVTHGITQFWYNYTYWGDGGAIWAGTDSSVTAVGAAFLYNQANLRGGAIYMDGGANSLLDVTDGIFGTRSGYRNAAAIGGAIYLGNGGTMTGDGASFVDNYAFAGSGGAIYAGNFTHVNVSNQAEFIENEAAESGGAIYLGNSTTLTADIAMFASNAAADGDGGAIRAGNASTVSTRYSTFYGNHAIGANADGGAIALFGTAGIGRNPLLDITGATFQNNTASTTAGGSGGGVYATDTKEVVAYASSFLHNSATTGGAMYLRNTDILNLKNAMVTYNTATDQGGGIYFAKDDGTKSEIWLGTGVVLPGIPQNEQVLDVLQKERDDAEKAFNDVQYDFDAGKATPAQLEEVRLELVEAESKLRQAKELLGSGLFSQFAENNGVDGPASFYFDVIGGTTEIDINIETSDKGTLHTADPFAVDKDRNQVYLKITKTGNGIWQLGGDNKLEHTNVGTTIDINEGIFAMEHAQLFLTNIDGGDYLKMLSGTGLTTYGNNRIETTNLTIANDTTMRLNGSLTLNIGNDYSIGSTLSGSGDFIKEDAGELRFHGETEEYTGNVHIQAGTFNLDKDTIVPNSGHFKTAESFDMAPYTVLKVIADAGQAAVTAKTMKVESVELVISGLSVDLLSELTSDQDLRANSIILLHTTDGIAGEFKSIGFGTVSTPKVDYLTYNLGFLNDHKDYGGAIDLRWYSITDEDGLRANGTFTLGAGASFAVYSALNDNTVNLEAGWNGKDLTKNGPGTLTLAAQNGYTGATTINDGELIVKNARGTGIGPELVTVNRLGTLVLDFNGTYEKSVDGAGKLAKRGTGTVDLIGTNTYRGGTELEDGSLGISKTANIGSGAPVLFSGGILRSNAVINDFNRELKAEAGQNVRLETEFDLTVLSPISDSGTGPLVGGLVKTGEAMLTLKGANSYSGATLVQAGTLKLDGSVVGDVRVSNGGAVGGGGTIGGNLFINSGGALEWFFSPTSPLSPALNVANSVTLYDGAVFRPRTSYQAFDFTQSMVGWTVLRYGGSLFGEFTEIDARYSPFYDFELDYSVSGEVRVAATLLSRPKTLSDSVTTSLVVANRRMNRNAFMQMDREATYGVGPLANAITRGQGTQQLTRSAWFTPTIRANRYGSTFHVNDPYWFESYGMQAGSTVWSDRLNTLGFTFGYERGLLHNHTDSVRAHDYFLGLYHGHVFSDVYEIRSFLGTGFQDFTSFRNDGELDYVAKYKGGSFEANVELARLYVGRNGYLLRPFIGLDLEYAHIETGEENEVGYEFRQYPRSSLTQFYARLGAEIQRRWSRFDIHGGATLRGLLIGPVRPEGNVFYPKRGAGSEQRGARMGSSGVTLTTGFNWYLDRRKTAGMSFDYTADIFFDSDANAAMHTGSTGLFYRF